MIRKIPRPSTARTTSAATIQGQAVELDVFVTGTVVVVVAGRVVDVRGIVVLDGWVVGGTVVVVVGARVVVVVGARVVVVVGATVVVVVGAVVANRIAPPGVVGPAVEDDTSAGGVCMAAEAIDGNSVTPHRTPAAAASPRAALTAWVRMSPSRRFETPIVQLGARTRRRSRSPVANTRANAMRPSSLASPRRRCAATFAWQP
jgi:hypothetical protein